MFSTIWTKMQNVSFKYVCRVVGIYSCTSELIVCTINGGVSNANSIRNSSETVEYRL